MPEDIKWVVGLGFSFVSMATAAFFNLSARIKSGDEALHARINKVRDDYVRREDLNGHINRLERNVDDLRNEIRINSGETGKRLDAILIAVQKK